jgi:hypothetical protein
MSIEVCFCFGDAKTTENDNSFNLFSFFYGGIALKNEVFGSFVAWEEVDRGWGIEKILEKSFKSQCEGTNESR